MTQLETEIINFFKSSTGLKNIDLDTNIGSEEYKIFDLDAENLMETFFKKYNINYSNFTVSKYFIYPDYSWKSLIFFRFFFNKVKYPLKSKLTIKHLIEVVKKKEWFDPT
ncbi:DUF1493 family protein [Flavobacterium sp. EDS]|uniref:DUF1493 family protein n=1 Tax=Flavobacterium sp. EDS TaxID=2897328 RepID=UPI001E63C517|nr:DUF1493 family protein [Flavobacterium sp. EDS]MCD0473220.1 DUF1493 family protein [Flavobacterium sp. EDS]